MAWKLGASMADMSFVSGTYGSHPETGEAFHELLTAYYMGAIIVNRDGRRFVDESQSYKVLGRETLPNPRDSATRSSTLRSERSPNPGVPLNDIDLLETIGHVHKADTLSELADIADIAGIDRTGLLETVVRYNAAVAGECPDDFGRTGLCNGVDSLVPLDGRPSTPTRRSP